MPTSAARRPLPAAARSTVVATVVGALALAGCGSGDDEPSGALAALEISGDLGTRPTVEVETPFSLDESATRTVVEGDGDAVAESDAIQVDVLWLNATDGSEVSSSYESGPQTVSLTDELTIPFIRQALRGTTVGDRIVIGLAPTEAFAGQTPAPNAPVGPEDTQLYVVDILGVVPDAAEGEEVGDLPEGLPTVQTEGEAVTGIEVPGGEPPAELVVQPLIEGTGDPVEADDTVTVHYWGVLWDGGETFDSSWERDAPASFSLQGVVPGWTEGLAGQPVGSRVLLVIPPDLGYGSQEQADIPPDSTLVFVVDILAA